MGAHCLRVFFVAAPNRDCVRIAAGDHVRSPGGVVDYRGEFLPQPCQFDIALGNECVRGYQVEPVTAFLGIGNAQGHCLCRTFVGLALEILVRSPRSSPGGPVLIKKDTYFAMMHQEPLLAASAVRDDTIVGETKVG